MRGQKVIQGIGLERYTIVFSRRDAGVAQDFIQTLQRVGPPMGIMIGNPYV